MLPNPLTWRRLRPGRLLGLVVAALVLAACSTGPARSFDPSGPCGIDGRVSGAYPDLEALLPPTFEGTPPGTVDSGRHCSETALGSLIAHDVTTVQFAGAIWDLGSGSGISSAIFRLPTRNLPADWISEFYEIGARTAKRTENIATSRPNMTGIGSVFRLDTLNDLSFQSVVVWQDGPDVRVVLVATSVRPDATRAAHDSLVDRAVAATLVAPPVPSAGG